MSFVMDDLPLIGKKLINTEIGIHNDLAYYMNLKYETNQYYKYPLSVFLESYAVTEYYIKHFAYIELPGGARKYSPIAEFVIGKKDCFDHPIFGKISSKTLVFTNGAIYVNWNDNYFDMILYVDKKYLDAANTMPTPDQLLEYKITSKFNFEEFHEYHFIDRHF